MSQPDDEHPERVLLQADAILVIQPTWVGWLTAFIWRLPTTPIKVYLEVGYCELEGPVIGTQSFQVCEQEWCVLVGQVHALSLALSHLACWLVCCLFGPEHPPKLQVCCSSSLIAGINERSQVAELGS